MENAKVINNINYWLETKFGVKDLDFHTYLGKDKELYKKWVDYVAGDGYWDELSKQMFISWDKNFDRSDRQEAKQNINALYQYFVQEINMKKF